MKKAIESHPDVLPLAGSLPAPRQQRGERATGSNDDMDVESVASSGRRPKAKARPREQVVHPPEGMFILRYDRGMNLSDAVRRRRGDYNNEDIAEIGLESHDAIIECIQTSTSPRDISLPRRGDRRIYRRHEDRSQSGYENPGYVCIADNVYGGILEKIPTKGHNCPSCMGELTYSERGRWLSTHFIRSKQPNKPYDFSRRTSDITSEDEMAPSSWQDRLLTLYDAMKVGGYDWTNYCPTNFCGDIIPERSVILSRHAATLTTTGNCNEDCSS